MQFIPRQTGRVQAPQEVIDAARVEEDGELAPDVWLDESVGDPSGWHGVGVVEPVDVTVQELAHT